MSDPTESTIPSRLARPLAQRTSALPYIDSPLIEANLPASVIDAAVEALHRGETHYTDRPGILPLRELVAEQLNSRYGIGMTPKDITITCGVEEARFAAFKLLAREGTMIQNATGSPVESSFPAALVNATFTSQTTDPSSVLWVSGRTNFTTSGDWSARAIADNTYIVWDDTLYESGDKFHPAQDDQLRSRVVTVGGIEGEFAGWRIGWMCGSDMAEKLRSFKQSMTICSTAVSQWAAVEWMKGMQGNSL